MNTGHGARWASVVNVKPLLLEPQDISPAAIGYETGMVLEPMRKIWKKVSFPFRDQNPGPFTPSLDTMSNKLSWLPLKCASVYNHHTRCSTSVF